MLSLVSISPYVRPFHPRRPIQAIPQPVTASKLSLRPFRPRLPDPDLVKTLHPRLTRLAQRFPERSFPVPRLPAVSSSAACARFRLRRSKPLSPALQIAMVMTTPLMLLRLIPVPEPSFHSPSSPRRLSAIPSYTHPHTNFPPSSIATGPDHVTILPSFLAIQSTRSMHFTHSSARVGHPWNP
ncbi:hypothetical protein C8R43DRAFT_1049951, partial [Mycena crocata]